MAQTLFRPNGNCGCDGGRDSLHRPLIFSARNNGEAIRLRATPSCAKTFRVELPGAGGLVRGLLKKFTGHFSIWRKDHFEFSAGKRCGREGLAREEGCLNLAWRHGLRGYNGARSEEHYCKSEQTYAQHGKTPLPKRSGSSLSRSRSTASFFEVRRVRL